MSPGGDRRESLLQLVEGVPRGRQEAAFGRYRPPASSGEVKDLRREMHDLKEALAEQVLENRLLKKGDCILDTTAWGMAAPIPHKEIGVWSVCSIRPRTHG